MGSSTSGKEHDAEPLAPASGVSESQSKSNRRCSCRWRAVMVLALILVVLVIVIVILALTVFKAKEPKTKLDKISIQGLSLNSTGNGLQLPPMSSSSSSTDVTVTLQAEMSIKNPNAASFRFSNATTALYYQGINIGEATNPAGNARARRTLTMNVTVDVWTSKLTQLLASSSSSQLADDVASRSMKVETASVIKGRVKILGFIKKHVKVEMNCTMTIDLSTDEDENDVHLQHCDRHVTL